MNRKAPQPDILTFNFREIELSEIPQLVPPNHKSKYYDLHLQIKNRIESMPAGKSFVFSPANGTKLRDDRIGRICSGVNVQFIKHHMPWKLLWSVSSKVFVVTPHERRSSILTKPKSSFSKADSGAEATLQTLTNIAGRVFNVRLDQLQINYRGRQDSVIPNLKKALVIVGYDDLQLTRRILGTWLDMKPQSIDSMKNDKVRKRPEIKALVETIRKALASQ